MKQWISIVQTDFKLIDTNELERILMSFVIWILIRKSLKCQNCLQVLNLKKKIEMSRLIFKLTILLTRSEISIK